MTATRKLEMSEEWYLSGRLVSNICNREELNLHVDIHLIVSVRLLMNVRADRTVESNCAKNDATGGFPTRETSTCSIDCSLSMKRWKYH